MMRLKEAMPAIEAEFKKGKFVVQKTGKQFSRIAIDQGHAQHNDELKGVGGIIGLTENDAALL